MEFLVLIEPGDDERTFGVVVPSLPGCFSAGDTLEEALSNGREAIVLHIESLLDAGESLPVVDNEGAASAARNDEERAGWIVALVSVPAEALDGAMERINISMPRRVLHAIDRAASEQGKSRSGFLAEAGLRLAAEH